MRMKVDLGDTV